MTASAKHQVFEKSYFHKVDTLQNSYFLEAEIFQKSRASSFSGKLLFQSDYFIKSATFLQLNFPEKVFFTASVSLLQ